MSIRRMLSIGYVVCACLVALGAGLWPAHAASGSTFVFFEKFPPNNPEQWHVQKLSDGSQTYLKPGSYHVVRPHPGTMRGWPLGVKVPQGFQFNVQLQMDKGSDPYEGVTFWDDLSNNFILFAITPNGTAGLFRHSSKGYTRLIDWRRVGAIHRGIHAINTISVNLDAASGAEGRTFLINGRALGKTCKDIWRPALGQMPTPPKGGFYVGVLAGSYQGETHVAVLRASMYNGTHISAVPHCS